MADHRRTKHWAAGQIRTTVVVAASLVAASASTAGISIAWAQGTSPTAKVESLGWLAGRWIGESEDISGEKATVRIYWTPPTDGVLSYHFSYNIPTSRHVHYWIAIFRDTDQGVVGNGLHFRKNFEVIEAAPRRFRLASTGPRTVTFDCFENCTPRDVSFSLLPAGALEVRWRYRDKRPDAVTIFRRV